MRKHWIWTSRTILVVLFLSAFWLLTGESSDNVKVWIFFKDRSYVTFSDASVIHRSAFSDQAIQRRQIRGLERWSESDQLVNPLYIGHVKAAGAKVSVVSRWLNAVSATCNAKCRANLAKLHFISDVRPVISYIKFDHGIEKPNGLTRSNQSRINQASSDLDYGPSKEQLEQINVPEAHRKGFAGQGETIALFSTGFLKEHHAFRGHEIVGEYDFVHKDADCGSGNPLWNGTAAWSITGGELPGKLYGPAYKSKIILAATDELLAQTVTEEDYWVAAFEFADRMGASVINGTLGYANWYKSSDYDGVTTLTSRVASMAAKKGIVVVSSMGITGQLYLPSDATDILAVGIADRNGIPVPFGTKGPTADGRIKPELIARGQNVYKASSSAIDETTTFNSGNEAASLVAGSAAVLLSARPDWNPFQVREALLKTASRSARPDNTYGYGTINLAKAIDYLPANSVVIDHIPIKSNVTGQTIKITARIRAQRGLNKNQLSLFWKKQDTSSFQRLNMITTAGVDDTYQAVVPSQSKGTTILYYITAKDTKGKATKAPFGSGKVFEFTTQ